MTSVPIRSIYSGVTNEISLKKPPWIIANASFMFPFCRCSASAIDLVRFYKGHEWYTAAGGRRLTAGITVGAGYRDQVRYASSRNVHVHVQEWGTCTHVLHVLYLQLTCPSRGSSRSATRAHIWHETGRRLARTIEDVDHVTTITRPMV